jgi:carboxyl-terminal processing protease
MRGPVNTPIKLTVLREGADKPIDITDRARHHQGEGGAYRVETTSAT